MTKSHQKHTKHQKIVDYHADLPAPLVLAQEIAYDQEAAVEQIMRKATFPPDLVQKIWNCILHTTPLRYKRLYKSS